jgi:hypothetical protein
MRTNGWGESTNNTHTPETVDEALTITRRLATPRQIYVHLNAGKYPKIESYNFGDKYID